MFSLTPEVKRLLIEHCKVWEKADDGTFQHVLESVITGQTLPRETKRALLEASMAMTDSLRKWCVGYVAKATDLPPELRSPKTDEEYGRVAMFALDRGDISMDQMKKALVDNSEIETMSATNTNTNTNTNGTQGTKAADAMYNAVDKAGAGGGSSIRVKTPSERYNSTKSVGRHKKWGTEVTGAHGRPAMNGSMLEHAKAGAFLKLLARKAGAKVYLPEDELALIEEMFKSDEWLVGGQNSEDGYTLHSDGLGVKTLLSDSTSGGVAANPVWFNANLEEFPLLSAELLPMVTVVDVPRGATVQGAGINPPTVHWGNADATVSPLWNTDAMMVDLSTNIHDVSVTIEVGNSYLQDAAVNMGQYLENAVGERAGAELDRVIAAGNGTTQPTGLLNASSLGTVTWTPAAPTVGNYEALLFGVGKQYRGPRAAFVGTELAYQRARGISVSESDQRRCFGMDHESYQLFARKYLIAPTDIGDVTFFGDMARFSLFKRQGWEVQWVTGGATLARSNHSLLILRGRFGGRVMNSNAFVKTTT